MKHLKWAMARALRRRGYELTSIKGHEPFRRDAIVDAVKPFTMTSRDRIRGLCDAVEYVVRNNLKGAIVECGVWRGGSMMAVALTLQELGVLDRDLYLFDTFDGMVEPMDLDMDHQGRPARLRWEQSNPRTTGSDWSAVSQQEVAEAIATTGYPLERIHFVQGRVEDTIPDEAPVKVALLRLDTDWYESYQHVLAHVAPRVVDGGIVIFDDYVEYLGARKAVDEWVREWPHPVFLSPLGHARLAVIHRL